MGSYTKIGSPMTDREINNLISTKDNFEENHGIDKNMNLKLSIKKAKENLLNKNSMANRLMDSFNEIAILNKVN